jgi:quercetin dioxygenase-like cupin family protein
MKKRAIALLAVALAGTTPASATDPIPDPAQIYPENYAILLENDCVRVMDFRLRRGATERPHQHPAHVLYVLEGFRVQFTLADGSQTLRETRAGDVLFSPPVTHSPKNTGDSDAHGILIELKNPDACPRRS